MVSNKHTAEGMKSIEQYFYDFILKEVSVMAYGSKAQNCKGSMVHGSKAESRSVS